MLYDANHHHEELFRKRVQAINREACTFNRKQPRTHEAIREALAKATTASAARQSLVASVEGRGRAGRTDAGDARGEPETEGGNEALQQKPAELSLQIAAVSHITVGGRATESGVKVKASRLERVC
jgi:hypothetical protein